MQEYLRTSATAGTVIQPPKPVSLFKYIVKHETQKMWGISAFQIIYKTEAHISVLHKPPCLSTNCTPVIRMAQKWKGAGGRNQWNTVSSDLTVAMEHLSNENC